ncbi:hypothetical protein Nepgr_026271 [Nepenthes gracilis]|uniref:Uncharacterized protein n=1 Tax=Nepenthes gracilis TaxID=150966 RepID=A0AAD3T7T5_NEPGR|nr:hypothetical protein Nepgr_026271 [Nepenthes gracilis]
MHNIIASDCSLVTHKPAHPKIEVVQRLRHRPSPDAPPSPSSPAALGNIDKDDSNNSVVATTCCCRRGANLRCEGFHFSY